MCAGMLLSTHLRYRQPGRAMSTQATPAQWSASAASRIAQVPEGVRASGPLPTPLPVSVQVESGALHIGDTTISLPIRGEGRFEVVYCDPVLRVFRSGKSYSVQVRARTMWVFVAYGLCWALRQCCALGPRTRHPDPECPCSLQVKASYLDKLQASR